MIKQKLSSLSPRVKELEALVAKQAQQIDDLRRAKFRIPAGRKRGRGKSYLRVVIPDTHGAYIDKQAAAAFLSDLEALKPAEIVHLGDGVDCGGFLAQHHTLGFVPECSYTFEDDVNAANVFLDEVQKRAGKVNFDYIMGNHEARIEKWIIKQTLAHPQDAAYLYRMFGPEHVLGLEKRGILCVRRDQQYDGLRVRGTIKRGKCLFRHGTRCGVNAAKQTLDDLGGNVCFGHTHRISAYVKETVHSLIGSYSFGCLCGLHPLYGDTNTSGWAHGYGVQVVGKDGSFMTIQVPIIDGRSYLSSVFRG